MSSSPRERKAGELFSDPSRYQAQNRFSNMQMPYSGSDQLGALNQFTELGTQSLKRQGAENVAGARSGAAKSMGSRGYGGSILQDAISGAGAQAGAGTTNALQELQARRLGLMPGIMQGANAQELQRTGGAQSADFQNISNLFGANNAYLQSLSGDSTLDDILGIATTAGGLATGTGSLISSGLFGGKNSLWK